MVEKKICNLTGIWASTLARIGTRHARLTCSPPDLQAPVTCSRICLARSRLRLAGGIHATAVGRGRRRGTALRRSEQRVCFCAGVCFRGCRPTNAFSVSARVRYAGWGGGGVGDVAFASSRGRALLFFTA